MKRSDRSLKAMPRSSVVAKHVAGRALVASSALITVATFCLGFSSAHAVCWDAAVLQVVQRALSRYLLRQAGIKEGEGDCGSVTLIQRFGSAANLNIHLHCLVLDGVYRTKAKGEPEFVEAPPPSDEQVWEVLQSIIKRVMKQLVRRGILVEDQGETYLADAEDDSDEARALRPLHRGSCVYRIAFGPRAGQKVLTLQGALPREASGNQKLCANS